MSHDSGEMMKKYVTVKQKHRLTKERNLLFQGSADIDKDAHCLCIKYMEQVSHTHVDIYAYEQELKLCRIGEAKTRLHFITGKKTLCSIESEYGVIDLHIYTHKYIRKDNVIAIEYDIVHDDVVTDGFYIIWNIEEGSCESD